MTKFDKPNNIESNTIPEGIKKEIEILGFETEEKKFFWEEVLKPYVDFINNLIEGKEETEKDFSISKNTLKKYIKILQILANCDLRKDLNTIKLADDIKLTGSLKEEISDMLYDADIYQCFKDFFLIDTTETLETKKKDKILPLFINDVLRIIASEELFPRMEEIFTGLQRKFDQNETDTGTSNTSEFKNKLSMIAKIITKIPEEIITNDINIATKLDFILEGNEEPKYLEPTIFPIGEENSDKIRALITIMKKLLKPIKRIEPSS